MTDWKVSKFLFGDAWQIQSVLGINQVYGAPSGTKRPLFGRGGPMPRGIIRTRHCAMGPNLGISPWLLFPLRCLDCVSTIPSERYMLVRRVRPGGLFLPSDCLNVYPSGNACASMWGPPWFWRSTSDSIGLTGLIDSMTSQSLWNHKHSSCYILQSFEKRQLDAEIVGKSSNNPEHHASY